MVKGAVATHKAVPPGRSWTYQGLRGKAKRPDSWARRQGGGALARDAQIYHPIGSHVFRFVLDRTLYRVSVTDEDIERYARILERSAQLSLEKYGTGFLVVSWDENEGPSRRIMQRLRKTNLQILPLSEVIPRSDRRGLTFPGDGHPKPEFTRRLAAALAARLSPAYR